MREALISKKPFRLSALNLGISLFLTGLCLVVFGNVRAHTFVNYDDMEYVAENPYVEQGLAPQAVLWAFKPGDDWMPLSKLSHLLVAQCFGMNASAHHLANLLFHVLNVLLVFAVLRRFTGDLWKSAAVAALFAVHPVQAEAVSWVTARKDLLAAFFAFWGLWFYAKERKVSFAVLVFFVLSLMSKATLVALPFLLILAPKDKRKGFGLLLAISGLFAWITINIQSEALAFTSTTPTIARSLMTYVFYLGNIFYPAKLTIYGHVPALSPEPLKWAMSGLVLGLCSVLLFRVRKKYPVVFTGWVFFILSAAPLALLEVPADRYLYFPILGIMLSVVWSMPKRLIGLITLGLLGILAPLAVAQCDVWKSSASLFSHALELNQKNITAHVNFAETRVDAGDVESALNHYISALKLDPHSVQALTSLGVLAEREGRFEEAEKYQRTALTLQPQNARAHFNLGNTLQSEERSPEAIGHFLKAVQLKPDYVQALFNAGTAFDKEGKYEDALKCYADALRIKPNYTAAGNNLGLLLLSLGRIHEAAFQFESILKRNSGDVEAANNLAVTLARGGDYQGAIERLELILKENPEQPSAKANLKLLLQRKPNA